MKESTTTGNSGGWVDPSEFAEVAWMWCWNVCDLWEVGSFLFADGSL